MSKLFLGILVCFLVFSGAAKAQSLDFGDSEPAAPVVKPELVVGEGEDEEMAVRDAMIKFARQKASRDLEGRLYRRERNRIERMIRKDPARYVKIHKKGRFSASRQAIKMLVTMDLDRLRTEITGDLDNLSLLKNASMIVVYVGKPWNPDFLQVAVDTARDIFDDHCYGVKTYTSLATAVRSELSRSGVDPNSNVEQLETMLLHDAHLLYSLSVTKMEKKYDSYKRGYWVYVNMRGVVKEKTTGRTITKTAHSREMRTGINSVGIGIDEAIRQAIRAVTTMLSKRLLAAIRDEFGGALGHSEKEFIINFDGFSMRDKQQIRRTFAKIERAGTWTVMGHPAETGQMLRYRVRSKHIKDLPDYIMRKFSMLDMKVVNQTQSMVTLRPSKSYTDNF